MLIKRSFAMFLIFLLSFTAAVSAAQLDPRDSSTGQKGQTINKQTVKQNALDKKYGSKDNVRIVVETKGEPAISAAQKQGKRYKDLPSSTKKQLKADRLAEHKRVKDQARKKNIKFQEKEAFTTVVNGFSAEVEYGQIESLKSIPEVKEVHIVNEYERPEEKPDMLYSKEMVQAQAVWRDYGYKGEGMVVGIIDTGIDPSHRDMVLSSTSPRDLTSSKVTELAAANGLPGKFYSEKVPYGYNYMDENEEIRDLGPDASMHGMHVAGTVGANGDEENGGIKGVAPEAQLLALKVFGNDPAVSTTWGDIYVKAIDDAIVLGADVLNMSLGSTAGFVSPEDPEQQAVTRAVNNGVVMSISAGNSAHFGNGFANPYASNPDIGVSGAPGLSYDSIQVASVENNFMDLDAVTYNIDGTSTKAPFMSASSVHPNTLDQKTYDLVYAGLGKPEELAAVDVKGKFALIQRGTIGFVDKAKNAQAAGAAGVIIYNNVDGFVSMATDSSITIPQLFMLKSDGDKIQAALAAGKTVPVTFNGDKVKAANPSTGKMSDFTSWGLTPNLDFKPEITAPGGQIYSTLNNNEYGMMSGTSMAAPHVSGGSALVLQRVDKDFGAAGFDRVALAKTLLMNTAQPLVDKGTVNAALQWNLPYSPRRQGAGVMQLHSALKTPVVVTEASTKEAKVALKEVKGNTFNFALTAQNFSDQAVEYDVNANLQTDYSRAGQLGYSANVLETQKILDASIKVNGSDNAKVRVPAKGSVTFEVTADLSNAKVLANDIKTPVAIDTVFPNGYFVEGYVTLKDSSDTNPELHVPYAGFKGNWDKAPIIDGSIYDNPDNSFYGLTGAVTTAGNSFNFLGEDVVTGALSKEKIAFSPNNDGVQDDVIPILSFLRNAKSVEYSILDTNGKVLRKLRTENNVRKNYYDGGKSAMYSLDPVRKWDGKVKNVLTADGQYVYQVKAVIDFQGAQAQTFNIPVKVDTGLPSVKFAKKGKVLTLSGSDNVGGSGLHYYDVQVDGKSILGDKPLAPATKEYTIPDTVTGSKVKVIAVDFAGNSASAEGNLNADTPELDTTIPEIHIQSPEILSVSSMSSVTIAGYVVEPSGVKEFTVDGKAVPLTYDSVNKRYTFSTTKTFTDGVHSIIVKATDNAGNSTSINRRVIVDSKAPTLTISGLPKKNTVSATGDNPKVSVTVADNFDEIRLYLDGSEIFYNEFKEPYAMRSFQKTISGIELELTKGKNTFVFEATDLAGHKTTKTVVITKQ
ncbi:S8 family serine peptidase [Peribacillus sp. SCS-155]|uniref:S8 family serine peptidase n=1 Tax=Peribacillus sedimenti TaxID=3115297 RepID=UPI003906125A